MSEQLPDATVKVGIQGEDAKKSANSLVETFERMQHTLELVAGIELFRGAREIGNIIIEKLKGPSEYADRILSMSAAAGVGVEQLQKLQFAAQQNGVSAENASMSLVHLNRSIEGAREGSKEAVGAFAKLGISQDQVKGFSDADDALMTITDQLKAMPDPVKRSAVAMELFGRTGASQLKWLASGSEEMAAMKSRAEALGAVVSQTDASALNEMGDIIESVGTAIKGFVSTLTARFAPAVIRVVTEIEDWWIANRKLIQSGIETWINNFLYWLGFLYGVMGGIIDLLGDWFQANAYIFQSLKELGEQGIAYLTTAIVAVLKWIRSFINNNQELVAGLIEVAGAVGAVYLGVTLWRGLTGIIYGIGAAMGIVRVALLAIDWELWLTVAAILAVGAAAVTAWQMLVEHKSFEDTWLGKAQKGAGGLAAMLSKFVGHEETADTNSDGTSKNFFQKQIASASSGIGNFVQLGNMATASPGAGAFAPGIASAPDVNMSLPPQTMTINAPVTLNAPAGTDPEQIGKHVEIGIGDFLDRVNRAAERSNKPNVRF